MNKILINPSAVTRVLLIIAGILVACSFVGQLSKFVLGHGQVMGLVDMFDLDGERNIPTFFSQVIMLITALLLAVIFVFNKKRNEPYTAKWAVLSAGFLFMSFDEGMVIHEKLGPYCRALLTALFNTDHYGFFRFAWIIPGSILVIFLVVFFVKFLLYLPAKTRRSFLLAGFIYVGGVIGIESVSGKYFESNGYSLIYSIISTVEESLEFLGIILFIRALLIYIVENFKEIVFEFDNG